MPAYQCRSEISAGPPARRSVRDDAAARELDDAVGDPRDLAVVGHDEHGRPEFVRLVVQELQDLHAGVEVQLARRLVCQQDRVAGRQRARDRHALLLTTGELVREVGDPVLQPDPPQRLRRDRHAITAAGDVGAELDVLERAQLGEQVEASGR